MVASVLAFAFLLRSTASPAPAEPAGSAASSRLRVSVRVDVRAAQRLVSIAEVMDNVRAIWQPYADISFVDVPNSEQGGFEHGVTLVLSDRAGAARPGGPSLGWITFVGPGTPGNFVTVSVATARELMTRDKWLGKRIDQLPLRARRDFLTRTVSWSVAHELGHYLLRTSAHAATGLMKAQIMSDEVMRNDRASLRLEPREVEMLRDRASRETLLTGLRVNTAESEP